MSVIRIQRIASNLQKEISDVIAYEMRDEDIKFVTITYVKLAPDLSYAKVYFTTLLDQNKEKVLLDLNNAKRFIQNELFKRKLKVRRIPELDFVYDESIAYGDKIDNLIRKLHND
jgi:ribosome-binding factor A